MGARAEVVEVLGDAVLGEVAAGDGEVAGGAPVEDPEALQVAGGDTAEAAAVGLADPGLELLPGGATAGDEGVRGHRATTPPPSGRAASCR